MREQDRVTLSDSEWIIMQDIWKRGEATFREICDGVAAHQWSKPAVAAFLKRMEKKGAIASAEGGPVKVYRSLLRRETAAPLLRTRSGGRGSVSVGVPRLFESGARF